MNPALLTAAAGMRARMETLDVIGNNIANAGANGFKADQEFYRLFDAALSRPGQGAAGRPEMPYIEGSRTDFRQGPLETTGSTLDVALSGPGFLVVKTPEGELYTRNGSLQLDAQGMLRTSDGLPVLGSDRQPIILPREGELEISKYGGIEVGGLAVGQLLIEEFSQPGALKKVGHTLFSLQAGVEPAPAAATTVQQGSLEGANVNVPESAVRLIAASRHFDLLRRAATLVGDEMEGQAVERLGAIR
jgi:flagellar basal body rod protein FlgG